mmetsp:Transcript_32958/g.102213  ORF Transcript_32958/g.102213 Transcript_32958/m.102213 type:complete len:265 (+) Transcript_32958:895-1689(+)
MATKEHHCCAEYLRLKKSAELRPTMGRLDWPKTRTVPASRRSRAMTRQILLRQRQKETGNCRSTERKSRQRSTRNFHSGCSDKRGDRKEIHGRAAMPSPTSNESDVCTRVKVPFMKVSAGALRWCAQVTKMGFVASSRMKLRAKNPTEYIEHTQQFELDASAGSGNTSFWMSLPCRSGDVEACRLHRSRSRRSARLNASAEPERCISWMSVAEWLLDTGARELLRRSGGCGAIAYTSTATSTSRAASVTGQRWMTLVDISKGKK